MNKAIFLDRDGVINDHVGYVNSIDDFRILPGVDDSLKLLKQAGYKIFVVTNQGGIEKGFLNFKDLHEIHLEMSNQLYGLIDGIDYCPTYDSFDRKPNPGMIYKFAYTNKVDLSRSWMIGDMITDLQAGKSAGCKTGLVINSIEQHIKSKGLYNISGESLYDLTLQILKIEGYIK